MTSNSSDRTNATVVADQISPRGRRTGDRPLMKGQSALSLNLTTLSLPTVLQQINSEDWEAKVSGLEALTQIALEKPNAFLGVLNQSGSASAGVTRQTSTQLLTHADMLTQAVQAVIAECRNLRSQVLQVFPVAHSILFFISFYSLCPAVKIAVLLNAE